MMKTMKRILAIVMVVAMVMAMAVTVSADEPTGKITIGNLQEGTTYNVYQMFTWKETKTAGKYWYQINDDWKAFNTDAETYFDLDEDGFLVKLNKLDTEIATAAKAYAANLTPTQENVGAEGATVPYGYYLLVSSMGDKVAMGTLNSEAGLVLREKNTPSDLPTVDKSIENEKKEYKVGDKIEFKVVIEAEEGKTSYIVHDLMTGMDFDIEHNDVAVRVDDLNGGWMDPKNFTVQAHACDKECTFEIVINFDPATQAYQKIEITYSAVINEDYATAGLVNTVRVEGKKDTVDVQFKEITFTKVDSTTNVVLSGAEFELYEGDTATKNLIPVVAVRDAEGKVLYYRPAGADEPPEPIVAGSVTIKGLPILESTKNYFVKETKAPIGYELPEGDAAFFQVSVDTADQTITNTAQDELPETGGMGTTLFYTVGGMMVMAALVLLVTKKRMAA